MEIPQVLALPLKEAARRLEAAGAAMRCSLCCRRVQARQTLKVARCADM